MGIKLLALSVTCMYCVGFVAAESFCYENTIRACSPVGGEIQSCSARYGAFQDDEFLEAVQSYANDHITRNFQLLLMSSFYGNYQKSRDGFEKLFRKLSDQSWEHAIDLVKYIGKRGGHMNFYVKGDVSKEKQIGYENHELGSMSITLDMQKGLAGGAQHLHAEVTRRREHDAEVASYLENNFVHKQSEIIRQLSGYTNDLKHFASSLADPSLSLYLFDEYLKNTV